jgi:hypothetical protein
MSRSIANDCVLERLERLLIGIGDRAERRHHHPKPKALGITLGIRFEKGDRMNYILYWTQYWIHVESNTVDL